LLAIASFPAHRAQAQIAPANAAGVSMGHLHYIVRDVDANKDFWVALGGTVVGDSAVTMVRFPNVIVLLSEGEPSGGTDGSVVNHVAFRVESIAALEAQGFEMPESDRFPGIASVYTPEGERIEIFDDQLATNIGFEQAPGQNDSVAERHNEPLTAPIVTHHTHFYLPADQVDAARDWYVDNFGATPGLRWQYAAADLPGMNFNFSAGASEVQAPTQGRMLDHIGFEVENLEAFCRALEAKGVEFDRSYTRLPSGLARAFLTDPWGTYIELTEGLGELAGD
jgi:catechol 2,3-dioxygenase-like lactoylglutathione lyase family enzyme